MQNNSAATTASTMSNMTEENKFAGDIRIASMVYARLIRSPVASGTIESITHENLPDGYVIYTACDVPGSNTIKILGIETHVFAEKEISYKGEPVGILVGPDENSVNAILEEVKVTVSPNDTENEDTVAFSKCISKGDPEEIYNKSELTVNSTYSMYLRITFCTERACALASFSKGALAVHAPLANQKEILPALQSTTGLGPTAAITIHTTRSTAKNDSQKTWYAGILACQSSVASVLYGKPVKLLYSRDEQKIFEEEPISVTIHHKTAFTSEGKITAMLCAISVNAGSKNPFAHSISEVLARKPFGVYTGDAYKADVQVFFTRDPAKSLFLENAASNVFFAIENQIEKIANATNLFPSEIRQRNLPEGKFKNELEKIFTISDYLRKYSAYKTNRGYRSMGLAIASSGDEAIAHNAALVIELEVNRHTFEPTLRGVWIAVCVNETQNVKEVELCIRRNVSACVSALIADYIFFPQKIQMLFLKSDVQKIDSAVCENLVYSLVPSAFSQALSSILSTDICRLPVESDSALKGYIKSTAKDGGKI